MKFVAIILVALLLSVPTIPAQEWGIESWEYAVKFYDAMYEAVQAGNMGGAIVYAVKRG